MKKYSVSKANTIEEFLKTREKSPILSLTVFKDVCKRIKRLEKKKNARP